MWKPIPAPWPGSPGSPVTWCLSRESDSPEFRCNYEMFEPIVGCSKQIVRVRNRLSAALTSNRVIVAFVEIGCVEILNTKNLYSRPPQGLPVHSGHRRVASTAVQRFKKNNTLAEQSNQSCGGSEGGRRGWVFSPNSRGAA